MIKTKKRRRIIKSIVVACCLFAVVSIVLIKRTQNLSHPTPLNHRTFSDSRRNALEAVLFPIAAQYGMVDLELVSAERISGQNSQTDRCWYYSSDQIGLLSEENLKHFFISLDEAFYNEYKRLYEDNILSSDGLFFKKLSWHPEWFLVISKTRDILGRYTSYRMNLDSSGNIIIYSGLMSTGEKYLATNTGVMGSYKKDFSNSSGSSSSSGTTGTTRTKCSSCNGKGRITVTWYSHGDWGEKTYTSSECGACKGKGYIYK